MMKNKRDIRQQLRRNAVALISLVIAISSLGYNTWRNEASEYNRNQRLISIEVLRNVAELQQVVFHNAWDMDRADKGNPRTGWVHVLSIRDLSRILDDQAQLAGDDLYEAWEAHWHELAENSQAYEAVTRALDNVRGETHALLRGLD